MLSTSPFGKINFVDAWKTVRGCLIYFAGYVITATANNFSHDLTNGSVDVSAIIPLDVPGIDEQSIVMGIVASAVAGAIELGRRLMKDYSEQ